MNADRRALPTLSTAFSLVPFLSLALVSLPAPPAHGHTPHHDIYQLEVSPIFDRDDTLYVISRGNLLRSTDRGRSWKRLVNGLDHRQILSSLEISPSSPQVLYLASLGDGVFKSEDRGSSWSRVTQGLPSGDIHLLAVSPYSSDTVVAAGTAGGLFRTGDGGRSWLPLLDGDPTITAV